MVLAVALVVFALKVWMAAATYGTNDIGHWTAFADTERLTGPEGIYAHYIPGSFYNHPPLMGYYLQLVNWLRDAGVGLPLTIRTTSSLADVATALVVFELVRVRRDVGSGMVAGALVGASPVLFLVSGFHGNTDPIFTCLTLVSVWLLVDRRRPELAGVAIALAVGVKIIPFVAIPALLIYAWRQNRPYFVRFAAGLAVAFLLTWTQALLTAFSLVKRNVFEYAGGTSYWGIVQLGHWLDGGGTPGWLADFVGGGRILPVLLCAAVAAIATWRRPQLAPQAVAWALIGFLALGTAYAPQYAVWPVAACYLFGNPLATAYNLSMGAIEFEVYNRWNGGFPWYRASASDPTTFEVDVLIVPWLVLMAILVHGLLVLFRFPAVPVNALSSAGRPVQSAARNRKDRP